METIYMQHGQRVTPNVNNLSPDLLLRIKQQVEQAKLKGEKKSG